jgi:hypothetical protein
MGLHSRWINTAKPPKPVREKAAGEHHDVRKTCFYVCHMSACFTIAKFHVEAVSDNPIYLAQRERLLEGLREVEHLRDELDQLLFAYRAHRHRGLPCCRHRGGHG